MYKVLHAKLLTFKVDPGDYIVYVFKNLDGTNEFDNYIMCTKHPNWQSNPIQIGQEGFLKVKEIIAGKDCWYDNNSGNSIPYKYDGIQFFDFILDKQKTEDFIMI